MRLCATIGVFTPLFAVLFCSFWFRFGLVSGGFWCGCGFSLCLAVVRWAVDRRTAARATPVALPVGVILGFSAGVFGLLSGCFRVCDCMRWRMRLHVLAGGDDVPRCSTHGAPAPLAEGRGRLSRIACGARQGGRPRRPARRAELAGCRLSWLPWVP